MGNMSLRCVVNMTFSRNDVILTKSPHLSKRTFVCKFLLLTLLHYNL